MCVYVKRVFFQFAPVLSCTYWVYGCRGRHCNRHLNLINLLLVKCQMGCDFEKSGHPSPKYSCDGFSCRCKMRVDVPKFLFLPLTEESTIVVIPKLCTLVPESNMANSSGHHDKLGGAAGCAWWPFLSSSARHHHLGSHKISRWCCPKNL